MGVLEIAPWISQAIGTPPVGLKYKQVMPCEQVLGGIPSPTPTESDGDMSDGDEENKPATRAPQQGRRPDRQGPQAMKRLHGNRVGL